MKYTIVKYCPAINFRYMVTATYKGSSLYCFADTKKEAWANLLDIAAYLLSE